MASLSDNLYNVANFLSQNKINTGDISFSDDCCYLSIWSSGKLKTAQRQALKRAFGKLRAVGTAPSVTLVSEPIECGIDTTIKLAMYGAFECKVISERQELVEIPEVKASPARVETKTKYEWSCEPIVSEEEF